jgi:hypothetical protein
LDKHLERCADCRAELEQQKTALNSVRSIAGRETLDWSEAEWADLVARTTSGRPEPGRFPGLAAFPRRAWAAGLAGIFLLVIAAVILSRLSGPPEAPLLSEMITPTATLPPRALPEGAAASAGPAGDIPFGIRSGPVDSGKTLLASGPAPENRAQDRMSLTLVSQETGLKVHWTFNRNFAWEEKKQ